VNKLLRVAVVLGIVVGVIGFIGGHQLSHAYDLDLDNIVWGT